MSPEERTLRARIGAHALHSKYDSRELTKPARRAFDQTFIDAVDPHQVLPEAERARRAAHARKAHFTKLALLSAQARRKRRQ